MVWLDKCADGTCGQRAGKTDSILAGMDRKKLATAVETDKLWIRRNSHKVKAKGKGTGDIPFGGL